LTSRGAPGSRPQQRRSPPGQVAPGLEARLFALDVLTQVLDHGRPLDDALEAASSALPPRDRAFARALVSAVLRRGPQIEAALARFLHKPLPAKARALRRILALGAAQILFLSVPDHAAVDLSIRLARSDPQALHYAGLVNAVLRALAREGAALTEAPDAARMNMPGWLWDRWSRAYGEEAARSIAGAALVEPPLDLTPRGDPGALAEELSAVLLPTGSVRLVPDGPVTSLPGYAEGRWWVQDAAAALPARLLGAVAGLRVADLCAAPGGKTAQLAAAGAQVLSLDRSEARLGRLAQNLQRLRLSADIVQADLTQWTTGERFDAVLLDAPCTATGTIRRHPDILRLRRPADLATLADLQARLLGRAAELVKPGGLLVYATCSLEPEEGEAQVARLLGGGAPFRRVPVDPAEIGGLSASVTPDGDLRTLPFHLTGTAPRLSGLDGFFAARLRRAS